jgi:hypothetical protein
MGQWTQVMKIERKRAGVMRKFTQNKMAASTKSRWDDEHRKGMDDRKGETHQIQNGGLHQNHAVKRPGGKSQEYWKQVENCLFTFTHTTKKQN